MLLAVVIHELTEVRLGVRVREGAYWTCALWVIVVSVYREEGYRDVEIWVFIIDGGESSN